MSREIILEAMNGIRDEYITEVGAKLGLVAVGAAGAMGAAVEPSALYSLSGTEAAAKAGFGAWVAKGGWIALAAGVLVAAGVAAGAFFFGKGGDVPPVESGDVTATDTEQDSFEATDEETSVGTEGNTQDGTHDETTEETEPEIPVFDVTASLAAIDKLSDENLFVALRYQTTTARDLNKVVTGKFGEADGKYWTSMSDPVYGAAVMEEEGGYYHIFNLDFSQWKYYDTTVMTDSEAFEEVYNARYWWKNYLDDLSFDAYDELIYTENGQVLEQDCHMFSYDGPVAGVGNFKLTLYVHAENRNVMKMELSIDYSDAHHVDDVLEAIIEISNLQTGNEVEGPILRPKWDGPIDEPDETQDPTQGGVVIPPVANQSPSIDVESGRLEQLPLTSSDDTTSYVVLPDLWASGSTATEFYVLPTDTTDPTHTCALRYEIPENSTVNIQIVTVEKSPTEYSILYMMEFISDTVVEGVDTHRIFMTCAEIQFFTDVSLSGTQDCYYTLRGGKVADITYTDETMQDVIDANRAESQAALEQAEAILANYTEDAGYQYTILYCHTKNDEIFNTPSYWIQPFFFELYREYGLME